MVLCWHHCCGRETFQRNIQWLKLIGKLVLMVIVVLNQQIEGCCSLNIEIYKDWVLDGSEICWLSSNVKNSSIINVFLFRQLAFEFVFLLNTREVHLGFNWATHQLCRKLRLFKGLISDVLTWNGKIEFFGILEVYLVKWFQIQEILLWLRFSKLLNHFSHRNGAEH